MTDAAKSSFVYVTYIRTTPEKLWAALTTPEFMKKYWFGMNLKTDWKVGSHWKLGFPDGRVADTGEVVEIDRPKRLVLRWRNQFRPELHEEGDARCKLEIEPAGEVVKLTIIHEFDQPGSKLIGAVSIGWPKILSSLKTLLETGTALAIDSKLRGCDLVRLQVDDVCAGGSVRDRGTVVQKKTGRPVQFEITEQTRASIRDWLSKVGLRNGRYLFPSRFRAQPHLSTRQYARIVRAWVESAGLDTTAYGTHSMRRTKAAQIYKKTGNLRAVQLLLGHTKLESTVGYLGIEVDDALSISEQVEL